MIEYERLLNFCLKHGLKHEQFMLLYTIYLRNENSKPELHALMSKYYSDNTVDWYTMIETLEKKDFLVILDRKKELRKYLIKDLRLTDFFVNLLFTDEDEVWNNFLKRYPLEGMSPTGFNTFESAISQDGEADKLYFLRNILKDRTPDRVSYILTTMEQMFKWDGKKPTEYARVGISKFLRNWETYLRMHEQKEEENDKSSRRSTRL